MQSRKEAEKRIEGIIQNYGISGIDGLMMSKMTTFEVEELRKHVEQLTDEEQQKFYAKIEQTYPEELKVLHGYDTLHSIDEEEDGYDW